MWAELLPLSPAEADAIIEKQFSRKAEEKAAKLARVSNVKAFTEARHVDAKGRTIIIRDVERPTVVPPVVAEQVQREGSSPLPSPKWAKPTKKHRSLALSATVHDKQATHLRWIHNGHPYEAWSNVDFNYLRPVTGIETKFDSFTIFKGIGDLTTPEEENSLIPNSLPSLSDKGPLYMMVDQHKASKEATAALDALLDYYADTEAELKVKHQRHEALATARKRFLEANPPKPETLHINFSRQR